MNQILKRMSKCTAVVMIVLFGANAAIVPISYAQVASLPEAGSMVQMTPKFDPMTVKGIKFYADNPFKFDFIVDIGDQSLSQDEIRAEGQKLASYFLASLTTPEKEMWVNLSPYEKGRIIPKSFGDTQMGSELLGQDYVLKQIMATALYPERQLGKEFWGQVYAQAQREFGTTNIPVSTFNKVWIVPSKAVVYQNAQTNSVFVVESKLKVMLEQDYLAANRHKAIEQLGITESDLQKSMPNDAVALLSSKIIKQIVIPALEREVNEGQHFAPLRQIYQALILASWYKKNLRESILAQGYVNRHKNAGVDTQDKQINEKIYQQYLKAYRLGAFNFIKEEVDPVTNVTTPRKYFSGGLQIGEDLEKVYAQDNSKTAAMSVRQTLEKLVTSKLGLAVLAVALTLAVPAVSQAATFSEVQQVVGSGKLTFQDKPVTVDNYDREVSRRLGGGTVLNFNNGTPVQMNGQEANLGEALDEWADVNHTTVAQMISANPQVTSPAPQGRPTGTKISSGEKIAALKTIVSGSGKIILNTNVDPDKANALAYSAFHLKAGSVSQSVTPEGRNYLTIMPDAKAPVIDALDHTRIFPRINQFISMVDLEASGKLPTVEAPKDVPVALAHPTWTVKRVNGDSMTLQEVYDLLIPQLTLVTSAGGSKGGPPDDLAQFLDKLASQEAVAAYQVKIPGEDHGGFFGRVADVFTPNTAANGHPATAPEFRILLSRGSIKAYSSTITPNQIIVPLKDIKDAEGNDITAGIHFMHSVTGGGDGGSGGGELEISSLQYDQPLGTASIWLSHDAAYALSQTNIRNPKLIPLLTVINHKGALARHAAAHPADIPKPLAHVNVSNIKDGLLVFYLHNNRIPLDGTVSFNDIAAYLKSINVPDTDYDFTKQTSSGMEGGVTYTPLTASEKAGSASYGSLNLHRRAAKIIFDNISGANILRANMDSPAYSVKYYHDYPPRVITEPAPELTPAQQLEQARAWEEQQKKNGTYYQYSGGGNGAMKVVPSDENGGIDLEKVVIEESGSGVKAAFKDPRVLRMILQAAGLLPKVKSVMIMTLPMVDAMVGI